MILTSRRVSKVLFTWRARGDTAEEEPARAHTHTQQSPSTAPRAAAAAGQQHPRDFLTTDNRDRRQAVCHSSPILCSPLDPKTPTPENNRYSTVVSQVEGCDSVDSRSANSTR